jgi:hypothetical protein
MRRRVGIAKRTGVRKVNVPNLSGLTRSQAQAALSAAGLTYSESTTNTSDSGLTNLIQSQSTSSGSAVLIGSSISFVYYNYVNPTTYGPCEAYGSPVQNLGSGNQCSGTFYQEYTDYRYNTRKKIYIGGVWDGSSYSTDGCGTTDARSITSNSQINGLCGYTAPCSITSYSAWSYSNITWSGSCPSGTESGTATSRSRTDNCGNTYNESGSYAVSRSCTPPVTTTYGSCTAYGDAISGPVSSRTACDGTYTVGYQTWTYAARRTILYNGSWDGYSYDYSCSNINQEITVSYQQINGSCGYTVAPPACICNYSTGGQYQSYHFAPECCPGGSQRAGSLSGTTVNSCCPNVSKTITKWDCKSYDVTNSASNNYFTCYYVGECAANNNSDGSRTQCWLPA